MSSPADSAMALYHQIGQDSTPLRLPKILPVQ